MIVWGCENLDGRGPGYGFGPPNAIGVPETSESNIRRICVEANCFSGICLEEEYSIEVWKELFRPSEVFQNPGWYASFNKFGARV